MRAVDRLDTIGRQTIAPAVGPNGEEWPGFKTARTAHLTRDPLDSTIEFGTESNTDERKVIMNE